MVTNKQTKELVFRRPILGWLFIHRRWIRLNKSRRLNSWSHIPTKHLFRHTC